MDCFVERQLTAPPARMKTKSLIHFRDDGQLAQSPSELPWSGVVADAV